MRQHNTNTTHNNIYIIGIQKRKREKGAENHPNYRKRIDTQIQEAHKSPQQSQPKEFHTKISSNYNGKKQ